jgi:hypothetical protein
VVVNPQKCVCPGVSQYRINSGTKSIKSLNGKLVTIAIKRLTAEAGSKLKGLGTVTFKANKAGAINNNIQKKEGEVIWCGLKKYINK